MSRNKKGMLIVLSGPSGVGKDTIVEAFLKGNYEETQRVALSVSATTRSPRLGEKEGVNYFYKTRDEFENYIKDSKLLEYAEYGGNYYGTLRSEVETQRNNGKHVILIIEVKGAQQIREKYPEAVFVFIMPPTIEDLEERLRKRQTEDEQSMKTRISIACEEVKEGKTYNYVIINEDVDESVKRLMGIIRAAECSPIHSPETIQGVCIV